MRSGGTDWAQREADLRKQIVAEEEAEAVSECQRRTSEKEGMARARRLAGQETEAEVEVGIASLGMYAGAHVPPVALDTLHGHHTAKIEADVQKMLGGKSL
jgi:hypothetical protein